MVEIDFQFKDSSKKSFEAYNKFLQSFILQEQSICQFLNFCEEQKCIIQLNSTLSLPLSLDSNYLYPVLAIKEEKLLHHEVERIKNISGLYENF